MRTLCFALLALAWILNGSHNQLTAAENLKLDAEKSKIQFVGSKPDGSKHEGGFKKFETVAVADFDEPSNGSLKIEIKTDSLWSDNEKLTGHLKNPDFFDVRKYPTAVFESTDIEVGEERAATITGNLTMLGKKNEIKIPVKVEITEQSIKLVGKFKLDRTKWGMNYGAPDKINNDVEMSVELHFER